MAARIQPVLMSGGAGARLWPLSRRSLPKPFAPLLGDRTLFQQTALRVSGAHDGLSFLPPVVIGAAAHAAIIDEQLNEAGVSGARLVLEPVARGTAPCAAVAALLAAPDQLILLLPSDHLIADRDAFFEALRRGAPAADAGRIVTLGIQPDRPETGYGYIQAGEAEADAQVLPVRAFAEKPDPDRARAWLAEGGWSWNAGIFLFQARAMIAEMEEHAPEILAAARAALGEDSDAERIALDADAFAACPSDAVDTAIMEKTRKAAVAPVSMGWSDVGQWGAIWELSDKDADGLALSGDVTAVDARNALASTDGPPVMLAGVEDVVVVVKDGMVLVTRRDAADSVKRLVRRLEDADRDDVL